MKRLVLKSVCALALMAFCVTGASAQGFLKKLKKAAETVTGTTEAVADTAATAPEDSISAKDYLANLPNYTEYKIIETNENGDTIRNEDGTVRYTYRIQDQNGKVCDVTTAKKQLLAALKSGGAILLKMGAGAAAGALTAKAAGGSKKKAWLGAGIGAATGLLASAGDIKEIKKQMKLRKELLKMLDKYQKTFSDEGLPLDANADLSDYEDCEIICKPAAVVQQELLASKEEGKSLPEPSEDEWKKLEEELAKEENA